MDFPIGRAVLCALVALAACSETPKTSGVAASGGTATTPSVMAGTGPVLGNAGSLSIEVSGGSASSACEGLECQQTTCTSGACTQQACAAGAVTTVSGVVYDPAGKVPLKGKLNYQACNDMACFPPASVDFSSTLTVAGKAAKK